MKPKMKAKDIIKSIKRRLTKDPTANLQILLEATNAYTDHPEARLIHAALGDLVYDLMKKADLSDNLGLEEDDEFSNAENSDSHGESANTEPNDYEVITRKVEAIIKLHDGGQLELALKKLNFLTDRVTIKFGPSSGKHYLSFSSAHEEIIYRSLYNHQGTIHHLPFDIAYIHYLYGTYLLEHFQTDQAIEAFLRARYYNPAKPDIVEKLCDCALKQSNLKDFEKYTYELHKISLNRYFLAICYLNFAILLIEKNKFRESIELLRFSQIFSRLHMTDLYLEHAKTLLKEPPSEFDEDYLRRICEENNIPLGPDNEALNVTYAFAETIQNIAPETAIQLFSAVYDVTYDENAARKIRDIAQIYELPNFFDQNPVPNPTPSTTIEENSETDPPEKETEDEEDEDLEESNSFDPEDEFPEEDFSEEPSEEDFSEDNTN